MTDQLTQRPFAGLDQMLAVEDKKFTAATFDPSLVTRAANGEFTSPGQKGHSDDPAAGAATQATDTAKLQSYLQQMGYTTGSDKAGSFGPDTVAALKAFQKDAGITEDGKAGVQTLAALRHGLAALPQDKPKKKRKAGLAAHGGAARFQPGGGTPTRLPAGHIVGGTPKPSAHQGKDLPMGREVKTLAGGGTTSINEDQGIVEAIVSVTGIRDRVNDIIRPGAYRKTLAERTPKGVSCVDDETEILTRRGWLRYDALTTDDYAYALNVETQTAQFEPVLKVNLYPAEPRPMRLVEVGGFSSLTTLNHRWPVRCHQDRHKGILRWKTTEELGVSEGIIRTLPDAGAPDSPKWADAFVEVIGWVWTEGWIDHAGTPRRAEVPRIGIAQSHAVNPGKCAMIRSALERAFPGGWREQIRKDGRGREYRLNLAPTQAVMEVIGVGKAPTTEFLLSLTRAQLLLLIDACMAGDGHVEPSGTARWAQCNENGLRMFEMVCALAGIPTNTRQARPEFQPDSLTVGNRRSVGAWQAASTVTLLRRGVARPFAAIEEARHTTKVKRTPAVDEIITHNGVVWCPTVPSGTWLARRNGSVYFTGNSHDWDVPVSKALDIAELPPGDSRLPKTTPQGKAWPPAAGGLYIKMQFNLDTQRGREAFSDVKFYGSDGAWSIGYAVPPGGATLERKSGTRNIHELELFEFSPVLHGAAPEAGTLAVKSADADSAENLTLDLDDAPPMAVTEDSLQALFDEAGPEIVAEIAELKVDTPAEFQTAVFGSPVTADDLTGLIEGKVDTTPGDHHRGGNAQTLRDYWAHGEGAAKIGWGTPGDFDRCVAEVSKYMPGQAEGYCNLRHHDALGIYPATHAKLDREGHGDVSAQAKTAEVKDVWTGSAPAQTTAGLGQTQFGNPPDALSAQSEHPVAKTECPHCHNDDLVKRRDGDLVCPSCGFHYADANTPLGEVGNARAPYDGALKAADPAALETKAYLPCPKCHSRKATAEGMCAACGAKLAKKFGTKAAAPTQEDAAALTAKAIYGEGVTADGESWLNVKAVAATRFLPCPKCKSHEATADGMCASCGAKLAPMFTKSGTKSRMSASVETVADVGPVEVETEPPAGSLIDNGDPTSKASEDDEMEPENWLPCPHCKANTPEVRTGHVVCAGCGTALARKASSAEAVAEVKAWSQAARIAAAISRRQHHHHRLPEGDHEVATVEKHVAAGKRGDELHDAVARDLHKADYHKTPGHEAIFRSSHYSDHSEPYKAAATAAIARHAQYTTVGAKADDTEIETKESPMMAAPTFVASAMAGSMEDLQNRLTDATDSWIQGEKSDTYTTLEGTWPDHVQFTVHDVEGKDARTSWQAGFSLDDDGQIELGEPQQIDDLELVVPTAAKTLVAMSRLMESKGIDPDLLGAAFDTVGANLEPVQAAEGLDEIELLQFEALKAFGGEIETKRYYSHEQRMAMAKTGEALEDGSFPIRDKEDLRNAVMLRRAGDGKDPAAADAHIAKRAAALGVAVKSLANGFAGGTAESGLGKAPDAPRSLSDSVGKIHEPQQRAARMLADMHDDAKGQAKTPAVSLDHETASTYLRLAAQHMEVGNSGTAREHAGRALSAHDRAMKDGDLDSFGRVGGRQVATIRAFAKGDDDVPPQVTSGARGHAGNIGGLEAAGKAEPAEDLEEKKAKGKSKAQAVFSETAPGGHVEIGEDLLGDLAALRDGLT